MFELGKKYVRQKEIHDVYKGQRYGGISTPADFPYIFIFTSSKGEAHGYKDFRDDDGVFHYYGQGQGGDMEMSSGNLAIQKHIENGKEIHVFRGLDEKGGYAVYMGQAFYIDHYSVETHQSGSDRSQRNAIVFKLDLDPSGTDRVCMQDMHIDKKPISIGKKASLSQLRKASLETFNPNTTSQQKTINVRHRSKALKKYVLMRSQGVCEACKEVAPFDTREGPYLEVHHIHLLSDGGPDHPLNVAGLCPNCHRKAHFSLDRESFNCELTEIVKKIEEDLCK